jgi:hypothetical protein
MGRDTVVEENVMLRKLKEPKRKSIAMVLAAGILVVCSMNEPVHAFCIWGFGQCASSTGLVPGEYVQSGNASAVLVITADKITSKSGPVSYTVDYTVKSVDGTNVTIEVSPPEPKETLQIQVEKDLIKIRNKGHFAGDWKKK